MLQLFGGFAEKETAGLGYLIPFAAAPPPTANSYFYFYGVLIRRIPNW